MDSKFFKNLNEITLYLLIPVGLICIISGMLYINQIAIKNSWLVNRSTDIPFAMILILYIYSKIKTIQYQNTNYNPKKFAQILEFTSIIAIIIVVFTFDLLFANQIPL